MSEIKKVKNVVIGSGPSGRLAALELGKLGQEAILVEKKYIAGTCLNEGCMVVCALTDISRFLRSFKRFEGLGFIEGNVKLSYPKAVEKIKKIQTILRKINEAENEGVDNKIIYGEASLETDGEDKIIVKIKLNSDGSEEIYEAEKVLIATGARPFIPDIKGKEYALVSSDILELKELPDKLNIVGGGIIANELSNIFSSFGCQVKIITRSKNLKILDKDIREHVFEKFLADVEIYEDTNVLEICENSIKTDKGEFEGKTLIATGRVPNSEIVEDIVDLNKDGSIKINEFLQSSNPNIYAAGDITGGVNLTPVARKEGISAARNMAGYLNKLDENIIPQSLTLDMDVSFTQRLEDDFSNVESEEIFIPGLAGPGAFWTMLSGGTGRTKVILNKETGEVLNVSSISPSSVEDTAYLAFLMKMGIKKEDFDEFLEIHPSTDAYYKILKLM